MYILPKGPTGAGLSADSRALRQLDDLAPSTPKPFRNCTRPQVGHRDILLARFPELRKAAYPEIFAPIVGQLGWHSGEPKGQLVRRLVAQAPNWRTRTGQSRSSSILAPQTSQLLVH